MSCRDCGSASCRPRCFRLCPICKGDGCGGCAKSIVPGVVECGDDFEPRIVVCSQWGDPEIDALTAGTEQGLFIAIEMSRDALIEMGE